ncbi:MAG: ferritin [Acidobacteriota bacterium]
MDEKLLAGLNEHLTLEFAASHHYLALATWFELNDLPGFSTWLRQQSQDELSHAHRIIDHLLERDQKVILPAIAQPENDFENAQLAVNTVLESEQRVTRSIERLYDMAEKLGDRGAILLLQWFIQEQMEEENAARALIGRLKLAGDSGLGLLLVDQELSKGTVPGAMEEPEG